MAQTPNITQQMKRSLVLRAASASRPSAARAQKGTRADMP